MQSISPPWWDATHSASISPTMDACWPCSFSRRQIVCAPAVEWSTLPRPAACSKTPEGKAKVSANALITRFFANIDKLTPKTPPPTRTPSKVQWHEFVFKGERVRESTRQGNQNVARQLMAARRTQLARGEVGIEDKATVPPSANSVSGSREPSRRFAQRSPGRSRSTKRS